MPTEQQQQQLVFLVFRHNRKKEIKNSVRRFSCLASCVKYCWRLAEPIAASARLGLTAPQTHRSRLHSTVLLSRQCCLQSFLWQSVILLLYFYYLFIFSNTEMCGLPEMWSFKLKNIQTTIFCTSPQFKSSKVVHSFYLQVFIYFLNLTG